MPIAKSKILPQSENCKYQSNVVVFFSTYIPTTKESASPRKSVFENVLKMVGMVKE